MVKKVEIRAPNAKFDLIIRENMPERFTDGLAQATFGPAVSKISFFTTTGTNSDGIEERDVNFQLCMPTIALMELAIAIVNNTIPNREALLQHSEQSQQVFGDLIKKLQPI